MILVTFRSFFKSLYFFFKMILSSNILYEQRIFYPSVNLQFQVIISVQVTRNVPLLFLTSPFLYDAQAKTLSYVDSSPFRTRDSHTLKALPRIQRRRYKLGTERREITRMLAIMKTSRRRASAIITGSQPYNLLKA